MNRYLVALMTLASCLASCKRADPARLNEAATPASGEDNGQAELPAGVILSFDESAGTDQDCEATRTRDESLVPQDSVAEGLGLLSEPCKGSLAKDLGIDLTDPVIKAELDLFSCALSALMAAASGGASDPSIGSRVANLALVAHKVVRDQRGGAITFDTVAKIGVTLLTEIEVYVRNKVVNPRLSKELLASANDLKGARAALTIGRTIYQCGAAIGNGLALLGHETKRAYAAMKSLAESQAALDRACKNYDAFIQCNRECGGATMGMTDGARDAIAQCTSTLRPRYAELLQTALVAGCLESHCERGLPWKGASGCRASSTYASRGFNGMGLLEYDSACCREGAFSERCYLPGTLR